jgi:radial spoke head protein 9
MEVCCLGTTLDHVCFPGGTLSVEERSAMEPALFQLQHGSRFKELRFWGKIRGLERDYFICQATVDADGKVAPFDAERVTFKSSDCISWTPLVAVDGATAAKAAQINGYFTGDLSKIYGDAAAEDAQEGEAPADDALTEEKRLSAFVAGVDAACAVVPVGAYALDARHRAVRSNNYSGLDVATGCTGFVHMRKPTQPDKLRVFEQKGLTQGTNFLDTVESDEPEGAWSSAFDAASSSFQMRHNVYPGFMAFAGATPNAAFGYGYFGDGIRNDDLAFQLPQC